MSGAEIEPGVTDGDLGEIVAGSYAAFAKSANARALADVRDGMKPVHRRVLVGLYEGARSRMVKAAKIVGDVLGR